MAALRAVILRPALGAALLVTFFGCTKAPTGPERSGVDRASEMTNPVFHFELPVVDMDRAVTFYEAVFGYRLIRREVDGYEMAFFPRSDGAPGASGALARGDVYKPTLDGAIIYFDVPSIDATLQLARSRGAEVLLNKTDIGADGYVAEIMDSEGNRIALSQVKD